MEDMKDLKALSYSGPREAMAERFHMSEGLLEALVGIPQGRQGAGRQRQLGGNGADLAGLGDEMALLVERTGDVLTPAVRNELQAVLPR